MTANNGRRLGVLRLKFGRHRLACKMKNQNQNEIKNIENEEQRSNSEREGDKIDKGEENERKRGVASLQ